MSLRARVEHWLQSLWWGERSWSLWLLWPLSVLYRAGSWAHRRLYSSGIRARARLDVPVISVGNLVVGGAGKTPVTLDLARRFQAAGRKVAVLSRGYGRRSRQRVVIVSDGETTRASAAEGGDEPLWLAHKLPGLIVVVASRRTEAAMVALDLGADLILLDDGFSHHALARAVDVLVIDAAGKLGNGHLLPMGPLREPVSAAHARASIIWLSRVRGASDEAPLRLATMPMVRSSYVASQLVDLELRAPEPLHALKDRRVLGVCGIARPDEFERTLRGTGAIVRGMSVFPDHHPFSASDVAALEKEALDERCDYLVTTEKDAMRLAPLTRNPAFRALAMEVSIVSGGESLDALVRRFARIQAAQEPA
jgi:tetraacyldisaccharide 4'-kinase